MISLMTLISGLLGALTGSMPKIFELFEKKMTFKQEMEVRAFESKMRREEMEFTLKSAVATAEGKMNESYYEAVRGEAQAFHDGIAEHLAAISKPTGYWIADMMNAFVRPLTAYTFLVLFFVGLISWTLGITSVNQAFGAQLAVMFGTAFEFVFGFYFGARAVMAPMKLLGK